MLFQARVPHFASDLHYMDMLLDEETATAGMLGYSLACGHASLGRIMESVWVTRGTEGALYYNSTDGD